MGLPLNDKQRMFCQLYVQNGGHTQEAAIAAGYVEKHAKTTGWGLLQQPHIQEEISLQLKQQMAQHGPIAMARIKQLMSSENDRVALAAAVSYAEFAGLKPRNQTELIVTDDRSDDELAAAIVSLQAELGMTPPETSH